MGSFFEPRVYACEAWSFLYVCTRDPLGEVPSNLWLAFLVEDERGDSNSGEDIRYVRFHHHPVEGQGSARAEAASHVPDEPLQKGGVVRLRWCLFLQESFEEVASPPPFAHLGEPVGHSSSVRAHG